MALRDEILDSLRNAGYKSARQVAREIGRGEKTVMRALGEMAQAHEVSFVLLPEASYLKLRYWSERRVNVRYYYVPPVPKKWDLLQKRWVR